MLELGTLHPLSHERFAPARARVQLFGFWGTLINPQGRR